MSSENPFEKAYPNLAYWVWSYGWIEMGEDDFSTSLIRILDEGGMVWESEEQYDNFDAALQAAEAAISIWFKEHGVEDAA